MRLLRLLALPSLVWACTPTPQELPGDPAAGGKLAREVCATCHIVSDDQLIDPGVGAPTFFEVIADPSVTALSLRVFLQTPHATMPDLILTPEETDDIIAYILRLRDESPEAVEQIDEVNLMSRSIRSPRAGRSPRSRRRPRAP